MSKVSVMQKDFWPGAPALLLDSWRDPLEAVNAPEAACASADRLQRLRCICKEPGQDRLVTPT